MENVSTNRTTFLLSVTQSLIGQWVFLGITESYVGKFKTKFFIPINVPLIKIISKPYILITLMKRHFIFDFIKSLKLEM